MCRDMCGIYKCMYIHMYDIYDICMRDINTYIYVIYIMHIPYMCRDTYVYIRVYIYMCVCLSLPLHTIKSLMGVLYHGYK